MVDQVRPSLLNDWATHAGARAQLVDVREPWELQTAAVQPPEGFDVVVIPMNEIPARVAELDPERPVACLCHHGARSFRVAMFLEQQGFAKVANIAGGIDAWSQELDPGVPRY
ncbi:MAG: sulfurtransferase [Burkholderiales bacterium]|nr:sulfurtransferase [Burkholderiales bacterium]